MVLAFLPRAGSVIVCSAAPWWVSLSPTADPGYDSVIFSKFYRTEQPSSPEEASWPCLVTACFLPSPRLQPSTCWVESPFRDPSVSPEPDSMPSPCCLPSLCPLRLHLAFEGCPCCSNIYFYTITINNSIILDSYILCYI